MQESEKAIPEPNFFQCPNIIIDEYLKELSGSELKCFLFIVRKTKGWQKDVDAISISQFEEYTGLSNRAVIDACNSLVSRGFIFQDVGQRGVKLFTLDCKKFTREKSSHVKKVHSTHEKSSQVTSEKSSHTKESIKHTTINKNNSEFFDSFWQQYPNKTAKQAAVKAWSKLKLNETLFNSIIDALKKQKPHFKVGFIPHASTWLNGKRWEDEVQPITNQQQPAAYKHFEKTVTPENAASANDFVATKKEAISEEEKARRKEFLAAQRQQNGESK